MNSHSKVYLDYSATTPVDHRVVQAMQPYFSQVFGNSSSIHAHGQAAEAALEDARESVARVLNCIPGEVIFTSCGSESDNLAVRGVALAGMRARNAKHILISPVEHHAVSRTAQQLAELHDFEVEFLPVDPSGVVHPDDVAMRIRPNTALVSIIYANNEIGTINPITEIGAICRQVGVPFHTDAVQAGAYLPLDVNELKVDLLSLGAHKFYGPKGVGVLYVRGSTPILPYLTGGGQEFGLRAGTHNIPYIVGQATALQLAQSERDEHFRQILPMRDKLIHDLLENIPGSQLTGHPTLRLPHHASFVFEGVDGNELLIRLDLAGFACSSGSACKTGNPEPSEVLLALGLPYKLALGSLRVSISWLTQPDELERFANILPEIIQNLRKQ